MSICYILLHIRFLVEVEQNAACPFSRYQTIVTTVCAGKKLGTLRSNSIYKSLNRGCTATYISKTGRHRKVRVSEHQGVSLKAREPVKGTLSTSVRSHMFVCDHQVAWEDFKILGSESNKFFKRDKPAFVYLTKNHMVFDLANDNLTCLFYIRFIIVLLYIALLIFLLLLSLLLLLLSLGN